ncbi:MAG TPA: hypothetical protein VGN16_12190 [Acidobacteriaceae bacterium]|jgi:hypothetical protein
MALPDISKRFHFPPLRTQGGITYKEASGELGVPGQVMTHRSVYAQTQVSRHTGEHAGHLIGIQFGAPGGLENLGVQNPNMNTFAPKGLQEAFRGPGGSYHDLESRWSDLLKHGSRITVKIVDKYRQGENRPFTRTVSWSETTPQGMTRQMPTIDFGNFGSPQQRAAAAKWGN